MAPETRPGREHLKVPGGSANAHSVRVRSTVASPERERLTAPGLVGLRIAFATYIYSGKRVSVWLVNPKKDGRLIIICDVKVNFDYNVEFLQESIFEKRDAR